MGRRRLHLGLLGCGAALTSITVLVSCLDDPREGDPVRIVESCDLGQLSTEPTSPQATLRAYVETTDLLLKRAGEVDAEMRDACNAINQELGLAQGSDAVTACAPIAARTAAIAQNQAKPPIPFLPNWAELRSASICHPPPNTMEQCVAACAGPCDTSKCEPTKLAAVCKGECQGTCLTEGDAVPCNGACVGDIPMAAPGTCGGECQGVCTAANWYGGCSGACAGQFVGRCAGTCTGICNGQPINTPDAGAPDGGADAGGGGGGGGPPRLSAPPTNADGNCLGVCVGVCSKGSDGLCIGAPCLDFPAAGPPDLAPMSGASCFDGLCGGLCRSAFGNGAQQTCTGQCAQKQADCKGLCAGPCNGEAAPAVCMGKLDCGQNTECENACQAKTQLATVCEEPKVLEAYAITDPALLAAWRKHGTKLGHAIAQIKLLQSAFGFIGSRAYGDFVAIGLTGDLTRACVTAGGKNTSAADAKIRALVNADPTLPKVQ